MDNYFRKRQILSSGEKDISVVRSNSVNPPERSQLIEPPKHDENKRECRKVAYQTDVQNLSKVIDDIKVSIDTFKLSMQDIKNDLQKTVSDVAKQVDTIKIDTEQSKNDRTKQKLDSFINSYNQNEISHSDAIKLLEKEITELTDRVKVVEDIL